MRVLLAIDGSSSSEAARRVVDAMAWPAATTIRVLGVLPPISPRIAAFGGPLPEPSEGDQESRLRATVHEATVALQRPGRRVERIVMAGRPASVIVDEAATWGAELIVVGSRGLGRLGTMLLGSVSAEVVDHAPCPVLVTRSDAIRSFLVAVDGSSSARQAVAHLGLGYLRGWPAEVIAVGPTHPSDVQADAIAAQAAEDLGRTAIGSAGPSAGATRPTRSSRQPGRSTPTWSCSAAAASRGSPGCGWAASPATCCSTRRRRS